jgi:hypothetical protein
MTRINSATNGRNLILQIHDPLLDVAETTANVVERLDNNVALMDIGLIREELEASAGLFKRLG